jgi:hypothetical protein
MCVKARESKKKTKNIKRVQKEITG